MRRPRWEAVVARCRGLASRLVPFGDTLDMARAPTLAALAALFERAGLIVEPGREGDPRALERAVRRGVGRELARLARWVAVEMPAECAAVFVEEEEVRSLRALLRGAVAGVSADARLEGLVPTPMLPGGALTQLASEPRAAAIVATLRSWSHPYAPALATVIDPAADPDLARLEVTLFREFAARVTAAAKLGGRDLERFGRELVDTANLTSALVLARDAPEGRSTDMFLPGAGGGFGEALFERVATAGEDAPRVAGDALADPELARLVRERGADLGRLSNLLLERRLRVARQRARLDPLGVEPVIAFVLALRAQARNLSGSIWSLVLGTPPERRVAALIGG